LKVALSIAGSDSGAGAGIQADLKTFSALGVYGCTAITAITAQNTKKVAKILQVSSPMIEQQIRSVMADMPPDAVKIGMVYSREVIDVVYKSLRRSKVPIVLDPIFAAGTGAKLLRDDAYDSFVSRLLPICTLVTPNRLEAERMAGAKIRTQEDGVKAARKIRAMGAKNVIVKGGHFGQAHVTDLLLDSNGKLTEITNPRVKEIAESHGSGCNFSSAVAAHLAKGAALADACRMANEYVHNAIKNAVVVGKGLPVTNPLSAIYRDAGRYQVIAELQQAVEQLSSLPDFYTLIPETQTNFAYALADAAEASDVAGVRGRIVRIGNSAVPASYIEFGASRHVASAILAYMGVDPSTRSAINIRLDNKTLAACKSLFAVSSYDRSKEPKGIKRKEGSSISWGTRNALSRNPKAQVVYHEGDIGKEPMIMVFGRNPCEVVARIKSILKNCL
jgi:hydroxymethylpyrimidine kinase / phosphomethylpyrimidine kinase / thiamine-phosphate diphosphorylase